METLIHADIFFFITSIAVGIFIVVMIIASVYIIKILKDLRKVSQKFQEESDKIALDVDRFREKLYDMEWDFKTLLAITRSFLRPKTRKSRTTTRKKKPVEDIDDIDIENEHE